MSKLFILLLLCSSILHGELDTDIASKKITIKGNGLNADAVLKQIQSQLDIIVECSVKDEFNFKKDYNHHVTVNQVLYAIVDYYRDYNKINLELIRRGKRKLILREKLEKRPKPKPQLQNSLKKVERDLSPDKPDALVSFDEPELDLTMAKAKPKPPKKSTSSSMKFEISDLVTLDTPKKTEKKPFVGGLKKEPMKKEALDAKKPEKQVIVDLDEPIGFEEKVKVEDRSESKKISPIAKLFFGVPKEEKSTKSPRKRSLDARYARGLDLKEKNTEPKLKKEDSKPVTVAEKQISDQPSKKLDSIATEDLVVLNTEGKPVDVVAKKIEAKPSRVLNIELIGDLVEIDEQVKQKEAKVKDKKEEQKLSVFEEWKELETTEWVEAPKVEQGYFGANAPWFRPGLLSYKTEDAPKGKLKLSLGGDVYEEISDPLNGVDVRTSKLSAIYKLSLSDEITSHIRTGLINHDGEIAVEGEIYQLDSTSLSDTVIGLNFIPKDWMKYGTLSFGLEVSLPTGRDEDFAGSGGFNASISSGYHISLGRWRGDAQMNISYLDDFEAFMLRSKDFVASYDAGLAYYYTEEFDFGLNLHWAESPWKNSQGTWGKDTFVAQAIMQSRAWTDPLALYVDIGINEAAPNLGLGLQWLREFQ